MKQWFFGLSSRDRIALSAGTAIVLIALLWAFAWYPLASANRDLRQRNAQAEADLIWLRSVVADLKTRPNATIAALQAPGASLLASVDKTAKEFNLGPQLKRVEPQGESRVTAWLENASFDQLTRWLEALQNGFGVEIEEMTLERAGESGVVNGRVALVRRN